MTTRIFGIERANFWPAVAAAGVLLLLLAGGVIVMYNEQAYKDAKTQQAQAQSRNHASTVTAALAFDDRKAAHEYVTALAVDPLYEPQLEHLSEVLGSLYFLAPLCQPGGKDWRVDPRLACPRHPFRLLEKLRPRAWVWESVTRAFNASAARFTTYSGMAVLISPASSMKRVFCTYSRAFQVR